MREKRKTLVISLQVKMKKIKTISSRDEKKDNSRDVLRVSHENRKREENFD